MERKHRDDRNSGRAEKRGDDLIETWCWGQMLFIRGNCLSQSTPHPSRLIFIPSWFVGSFPMQAGSPTILSPLRTEPGSVDKEQSWQDLYMETFVARSADVNNWVPMISKLNNEYLWYISSLLDTYLWWSCLCLKTDLTEELHTA